MKRNLISRGFLYLALTLSLATVFVGCEKGGKEATEAQIESSGKSNSKIATTGANMSHDPSGLVTDGSRFYQFTTGDGVYTAYSNDLINWTSGTRVFPNGSYPSWIKTYVSNFTGNFWAPDVINLGGKWYCYYSCSSFGSSKSAIGVATSSSLQGPWTDLGMVVYSDSDDDINAIDPGMFTDTDGRVYMSYGSFFGGLAVIEIDPATAKVKAGAPLVKVVGGAIADWEAPYIVKEGSYYYMFANRGSCCNGVNSTYYIQVARATSPTGPYSDWRTVLAKSGKYIGPGHFGLLRHNNTNYVSIHYYDGNDNGNAKLDILTMNMVNGWPVLTRDWLPAGTYKTTNVNSGKVWDAWGCTGASGQAIAQGTWNNLDCQKWNFTPLGNGEYKITSLQTGRAASLVRCGTANGTKLQLEDWANKTCQRYRVEKSSTGNFVFLPQNAPKSLIHVPNASTADGVQLTLNGYNGSLGQKWLIEPTL